MKTCWLGLLLLLAAVAAKADAELDAAFPRSSVVISASKHACHNFGVHLALDRRQWARGLMHVREMDPWRGMLFVYADDARRSMWMKNTFIPLDMLFIRADGSIESVIRDTEPQSLQSRASGEPVRYVLELNAGVTERLHINAGDQLWYAGDVDRSLQD